jgi:hypothetical protein
VRLFSLVARPTSDFSRSTVTPNSASDFSHS